MAERVKGTVFRAGKSKFGFYIKLDGDDQFYNLKTEPTVGEGDVVGLEFTRKGRSCNITQVKTFSKGSRPQAASSGGSKFAYAGGGRQDSIIWQHSQEIAVRAADVLLSNGAVKLPKAEAARNTVILGLVDSLTYQYFTDASDPRNSDTFKQEEGIEAESKPEAGEEQTDEDAWGDPESATTEDVVWD